ncbi:6-bladed beta-propeller [candidate division KSB1 bacterium]
MNKVIIGLFVSVILITAFTVNSNAQTIEIIDGVRYVHNNEPKWGNDPKVNLEFVQKIGGLEETDENYIFKTGIVSDVDKDGNIYIYDYSGRRLQKYDANGKFLRTIGSEGQGPGEFQSLSSFQALDSGEIINLDSFGYRFQFLSPEGRYLKSFRLDEWYFYFRKLGNDKLLIDNRESTGLSPSDLSENRNIPLFKVLDFNGELLYEFGKLIYYNESRMIRVANSFHFDVGRADNSIYVAFESLNKIEKYSEDGKLTFRADRKLNYEVIEPEYKMVETEMFGKRPAVIRTYISRNIGIDYKNRIWIWIFKKETSEKREEIIKDMNKYFVLEVFDDDGILLGHVELPVYFDNMKIFGDRMFLEDSSDQCCVYEYRIVEK